MKSHWPLAYASDFVSYVLQKLTPAELGLVDQIVVFGSAARGETTSESDVDLFVQTRAVRQLKGRLAKLVDDFESSTRVRDYWRPLGVQLPLSIKVGQPEGWAVLPAALAEHGRVLFGPYRPAHTGQAVGAIFTWENVSAPGTRTNLYRNLFGFISHGKRYPGLVERIGGRRLGKGTIWVPLEHAQAVRELFRGYRITCRVLTVSDFSPSASRKVSSRSRASSKLDR